MKTWTRGVMVSMLILLPGARLSYAQDIAGIWQGTLNAGKPLRIQIRITGDAGSLKAVLYSLDQDGQPIPAGTVGFDGTSVPMAVSSLGVTFEGKLTADRQTIAGTFTQGVPLPLTLARVTSDAAWALPAPPTPMAANAPMTFEVATIKPSRPDAQGKLFTVRGRQVMTVHTSLGDLISFAYDVHAKQIVGSAPWVESDKYDITGKPEATGLPSAQQLKLMMGSLLADRFKLTFHRERRELSVYAITVAKTGAKITKSQGAAKADLRAPR